MDRNELLALKNRYSVKVTGIWVTILILFIVQLLIYTWVRVQCIRIGYEISRQAENYQQLTSIQNTFRIELERLKSPERITHIAGKLNLVMPETKQRIEVNKEDLQAFHDKH
jgi:cell division protein FtsL